MPTAVPFGALPDGRAVTAYEIGAGGSGPTVRILDLGATVASLVAYADRVPIVLGHPDVAGYLRTPTAYHGAIVGRFANRIAGAQFLLDGARISLSPNEGTTTLHGGPDGFHARLWSLVEHTGTCLTLELISPDGDQGFPGELTARVTYVVDADGVDIELTARTSAPTVVSLTNHAYFNLAGEGSGSIDDHRLLVVADHFLPVAEDLIPTGELADVTGTPFDLRQATRIGERVRLPHDQLRATAGIDHAFAISGTGLRTAARLEDPATGRTLDVLSDQPSLQVYTGNALDGSLIGPSGRRYRQGDGIALETQVHPDSPNQDFVPSPVLRPGETYRSRTRWRLQEGPVTASG